jgi:hypothetical protein
LVELIRPSSEPFAEVANFALIQAMAEEGPIRKSADGPKRLNKHLLVEAGISFAGKAQKVVAAVPLAAKDRILHILGDSGEEAMRLHGITASERKPEFCGRLRSNSSC